MQAGGGNARKLPVRTSQVRRRIVVHCIVAGLLLIACGRPLQDPGAAPLQSDAAVAASIAPDTSAGVIGQPSVAVPAPEASAPVGQAVPSAAGEAVPPPPEPAVETAPTPTMDPVFAAVQLPPAVERWRYMQMDREVFDPLRTYATSGPETLWWYDPLYGQIIALGEINGAFPVQATFRLRGQEAGALEVPYQINTSFGLRLPDAIQQRMRNAGAGEWIETFVFAKSDVQAR